MNTLNYLHLDEKRVADVVTALHLLLADFQIHYTNLRGFHWDIKGHGFFVLHSKFEDLYNDTAEKIDEIAERILTLGSVPSNKFSDYLKVARIKEISGVTCGSEAVEHILSTYGHLIGEERKVLDLAAEAGDEVTVSLMSDYLKEQEKMVWMLTAFSSKTCRQIDMSENPIRITIPPPNREILSIQTLRTFSSRECYFLFIRFT